MPIFYAIFSSILIRNFPSGFEKSKCSPFVICGQQVGLVLPEILLELVKYPEVFFIHDVPNDDFEVNWKSLQTFDC